jgi:hypothetical protein
MANILKNHYGNAEGPLGFPLTDKQATALEAILKGLPKDEAFRYRKAVVDKAPTELLTGERSDVSWISTEDPDRTGDVILAKGMNDSQFRQNPIVTLNHAYWTPPVGKSLWRKFATDGAVRGIKAKTQYPARPADWPPEKDWPADVAFSLVQADLLRGKSIGFLPTKVHVPNAKELTDNGWNQVNLVVDEWILLEYACVFLPAQQNAVLESVTRALPAIPAEIEEALGINFKALVAPEIAEKGPIAFEETTKADADRAWDGDAAVARLRKWAGVDESPAGWDRFARGFAYYTGAGDKVSDYKLPHHDIIDGQLCVVLRGVQAAMAAVNSARGGVKWEKETHRKRVYRHLARHYKQFGATPPDLKEYDEEAIPFTALSTIERALNDSLSRFHPQAVLTQAIQEQIDRMRGRI